MSGWVYFIRNGDTVKIGYSANPEKRMAQLQTGAAHKLELLGQVPGTPLTERMYHQRFSNVHIRGEMFELDGPIRAAIEAILLREKRRAERLARGQIGN